MSVRPSVRRSIRPSVRRSVRQTRVETIQKSWFWPKLLAVRARTHLKMPCIRPCFGCLQAAGDLRKWRFHHVLMTELSLLSFLLASKVTELSLLHMFLGQKWACWHFFVYHFKSAQWILFIFAVELIHVIILISKRKKRKLGSQTALFDT